MNIELKIVEDIRGLNLTLKFDKSALINAIAVLERNPNFLNIEIYNETHFDDFGDDSDNCMSDPKLIVRRSGAFLTWVDGFDDTEFNYNLPTISARQG